MPGRAAIAHQPGSVAVDAHALHRLRWSQGTVARAWVSGDCILGPMNKSLLQPLSGRRSILLLIHLLISLLDSTNFRSRGVHRKPRRDSPMTIPQDPLEVDAC